ncbi:MAG TPA: TonB-dependent receptor [Terracidiphilus sp.]|nr:TonB-dependent receptor [Terracidiphilus sp.]
MKKSLWGWMLCCTLSAVTLAFGQIATTSLRGVITDQTGALVPGATVTLTDKANGKVISTTTNSSGLYVFPQIAPSNYSITATSTGFGAQTKNAELLVNQPATIDFKMSVQANAVTVDVSAEAQTLNTTDASLGNSAGNAKIQALPSETRNVPDLLSLQPGVIYLPSPGYGAGDSRSGAVNGSRSDQGNVTMDGIDDNDQVNGYAFTGVLRETQDSIEEFRVVTGDAGADAGRSSGAQVSMVTKSGTNKFHGAAYEYNRPTITVANDWFNKQAEASNDQPNVPGKLIRNIYGADLGGPVMKDKLFFFGNYEASRLAENQQVTTTSPTAAYQAGTITYVDDPAGDTSSVDAAQVSVLDGPCQVCNSTAYPNPPGPDPNALSYFNQMPAANGTALGDGYNTGSYSFSSPAPIHLNTSIVRIDFVPSDKQRIFVRGNLQDDATAFPEHFPGQPPSSTLVDDSKGIIAGDTWTISPTLVNDLRYGYIRQGFANSGIGTGDYVDFRFLNSPTAETRSSITSVPVNNIVDNLSWTKGNHNLQFGANWRLVHQNHSSNANSFNSATTNPYWLNGGPPDPSGVGQPSVDDSFSNSYEIAYANLVGTIPQITDVFNYQLTSATSGTALADGAALARQFKSSEFEWYAQDSWRIRPNLTLTFGIRHTLLQTPYETRGQEVTPTIDTHSWYLQRETAAQQGQIYEPDISFTPAGQYYGKPGYYPMSKNNFAPRIAVAYSPDAKTSFRAGAGIYYDHFGQGLINLFDQEGSFGMSSAISNPAGVYQIEGQCATGCDHPGAPRFIDQRTFPDINVGAGAASTISFPYLYPQDNFSIQWGLDSKIKTPYSETFDLSLQREFSHGWTAEAAYAGRLGRHLLQQLDLAEPVDYVDPNGGGDYYSAASQLSKEVDENGGDSSASVNPIPYFENVFPFMANVDYDGESATQAIYSDEWAPYRSQWGATTSLSDIDFYCYYGCPANWQSHFWQDQFSSLYAWSSIGMSYYNSGQFTLRHPDSHGLSLDVSYTYSHSIDMGSDTERSNEFGVTSTNTGAYSEILNTWRPYLNRGSSDFDIRHMITGDWVYILPFGRGRQFAGNVNGVANAILGGWQWSGIERWSSGLPFSVFEPGWSTDWQIESYGVTTGKIKMRRHYDQNGNPQFFDNAAGINAGVSCGGCNGGNVRLPYPGEAGDRNNFRGDGMFNIDSGLDKTWKIREYGSLKLAWEVYNVTNTVRFDPGSIGSGLTGGNLGVASSLLSVPRRMQFSLRFDF